MTFMKTLNAISFTWNSTRNLSLSLLAVAFLVGGCASPASQEAMVPAAIQTAKKHPHTVSIKVSGGQETDASGKSQISNEALSQALTQAIESSKTFSRVVQGTDGNYLLTVNIFSIEQPNIGFSFTVKMEAGWTLKRADNGVVVWQESVKSQHTATTSDAFAGVARLRIATEGAARNNIAQGLEKISKLSL
jgi:PBP1b-binding outer membrane lipoprotein LpoB